MINVLRLRWVKVLVLILTGISVNFFFTYNQASAGNEDESLLLGSYDGNYLLQAEVALLVTYATAVGKNENTFNSDSTEEKKDGRYLAAVTAPVSEKSLNGFREAKAAWQRAIASEYSAFSLDQQRRLGPNDFRLAVEKASHGDWSASIPSGGSLLEWMQNRVEASSSFAP